MAPMTWDIIRIRKLFNSLLLSCLIFSIYSCKSSHLEYNQLIRENEKKFSKNYPKLYLGVIEEHRFYYPYEVEKNRFFQFLELKPIKGYRHSVPKDRFVVSYLIEDSVTMSFYGVRLDSLMCITGGNTFYLPKYSNLWQNCFRILNRNGFFKMESNQFAKRKDSISIHQGIDTSVLFRKKFFRKSVKKSYSSTLCFDSTGRLTSLHSKLSSDGLYSETDVFYILIEKSEFEEYHHALLHDSKRYKQLLLKFYEDVFN